MTRLLAVRHGETEWNRTGRLQGWAPVGLNERGQDQARALAADPPPVLETATPVDRVVTSDLERTRETTRLLAEPLGLPDPEPVRAFRERHLGVYQGLPVDQVVERHPELEDIGSITGLPTTPEGGESLADLAERVRDGVARLEGDLGDEETALVVTHGGPIRVMLAEATGVPLERAVREHRPENCSVYDFHLDGGLAFGDATGRERDER